jgi:hypothetical protein
VLIGIITPAHNVAPWIGQTIASVIAQSRPDWAMVVVDDGSTDTTVTEVARFADPRLRLIRQGNQGVAAARNAGAAALDPAAGAVLFLDADDVLAPDALARLAAALAARPDAVAAVAPYAFVPADARPLAGGAPGRARPAPSGDLLRRLLERNLFANGGHVLIRREAAERALPFRTGLAYGEDWEFWVRLALLGRFAAAPGRSPALYVRQRPSGAYLRMATDPAAFAPCMAAVFDNPALAARFGADRLAGLRRRTEAENGWVIGRELLRHGRADEGRRWLRRAVAAKPGLKRAALLALAHAAPRLPPRLAGPFRRYGE